MNTFANTLRMFLKLFTISSLCVSLGLQLYVLLLMLYELALMGGVGFGSALAYGASQSFSVPAFLIVVVLTYHLRAERWVKFAYIAYFGSHIVFWTFGLLFPARFGA